MFHKKIRTFII